MKIKKEDELTKYSHSFNMVTKEGVPVTINLYRFKCDPPECPVFAGCRYYRSFDFWNQVAKRKWPYYA